ncbi:MAG: GNAT family N-acetyltransferase, partial [Eubacteriales bacterium]|nr:GNAT family N-acetyltransferase [Eubacteriales bacterium]
VIMAGHDGRRGYIYHTAVIPGRRNRGIGARLVESALEALEACGISKVALVVFSKNAAGNAFWERMGFSERGDLTYRNKALAEMVRLDT